MDGISTLTDKSFTYSFTKTNVQVNIPLDDKLFEIPVEGAATAVVPVAAVQAVVVQAPVVPQGNVGEMLAQYKFAEAIALINSGADIKSLYMGTKLMNLAVQYNAIDVAKLLVAKGADLNFPDPNGGYTPLHAAVHDANFTMLILLVDGGANINAVNSFGETPLKLASAMNFKDIAKYLRDKGGNK